jgi:hypothetical protein
VVIESDNLFVIAESCLFSSDVEPKLTLTYHAKQLLVTATHIQGQSESIHAAMAETTALSKCRSSFGFSGL